jgi:hypothetical protein
MNHLKQELELKGKLYTPNVMKGELIQTVENIYNNITIKEYKIVNVGTDANNQNAGAVLGEMMTQYNAITGASK